MVNKVGDVASGTYYIFLKSRVIILINLLINRLLKANYAVPSPP